jgi:hypothetical protein
VRCGAARANVFATDPNTTQVIRDDAGRDLADHSDEIRNRDRR